MSTEQDYLLITKGPRTGEKITLSELPLTIGRMKPAGLVIEMDSVSRAHARISREGARYVVEDLGSSNGTFVNSTRVQDAPLSISNGDTLGLGMDVEMRLSAAAPVQAGVATMIDVPDAGNKTAMMGKVETSNKTLMMDKDEMSKPAPPPQLVVNESGEEAKIYKLTTPRVRIGRQDDNDVVLTNRFVSRIHAELEKRGNDYYLVPSPNISNSLLLDGQPVMEPVRLRHGSKIRIGGFAPGEIVALDYLMPLADGSMGAQQNIKFTENRLMKIGRAQDNDIIIPAPTVSQYHAEVEKVGTRYRLRDLRSSNGTFVNGQTVSGDTWVHSGDAIQIGPYRFIVEENEFAQFDQSEGGVRVEVLGLNKWVNGGKLNILQDISLVFQPKEFIVVVGQSGGGKSTLVDSIAGYRPATHGKVIVNKTIDVYKEFNAIRSTIGFVPQKDIIHMELTVYQALDYAAQLRMPADTTKAERHKRIEEVMEDLDLAHRRDTTISQLSGGQQKRVSIGVELITKPGLFFLDEPTSGLDPGMETELMRLMRRLADQGRTIVMITHATKNVMLADKVVFLARGGFLTWFGPPEEALTYFDKYRTERDRRASPMEFDNIYTLLDQPELGNGAEWAKRYKADPAYQKYVVQPLGGNLDPKKEGPKTAAKPISQRKQVSALRQFFILSGRNLKIMTRDRFSLLLLIMIAPMMASLDFVLASGVGREPTSWLNGTFNEMVVTLISITNTSVLVGGLAMMRELVKERDIYKRERLVNLQLSSYILSKTWIAFILAFYQALCFTVIRYLAFNMSGGTEEFIFFFITEFLLVLSGTIVGLFCSALAPNANSAPLLLILFIIPQMVLSGALVQLPEIITTPAPMRWAFQSFIAISGVGSDVARDACWWDKTDEEREDMTMDEKTDQCNCMGRNSVNQDTCDFPGLGRYDTDALRQADLVKPAEPGPQPTEPVLPDEPTLPEEPAAPNQADMNNVLILQKYIKDLGDYNTEVTKLQTDYNDEVTEIQDKYKDDIDAWQEEQEKYKDDISQYQTDQTDIEVKRATAVGSAESNISRFKDQYGWTFVDKENRAKYIGTLLTTWIAQLILCTLMFIGTIIMQKRSEV